jgi:integrase
MYTGARINELAQLHVSDIKVKDGIHYFNVTTLDDSGTKAKDKRVKNNRSHRAVPIHPQLIGLGFLDYVAALRARGKTVLFEQFTHLDTGRGGSASRWYTSFRRALGITKVFHAYRDTMSDALSDLEAPELVHNLVLGHTPGSSMSVNSYGTGATLPKVKAWLDKLPINPGRR